MSEKMKQLRQYMKDNRGSEKTIQNSLLAENTQYEKNNYFTLLAVILQQVDNIPSGQLAMYKRLVAGASVEHSVEEYLQKALDIEIEDYENFIENNKDTQLGFRFLLDAYVITSILEMEQQIQMVDDILQALGVERKEEQYLKEVAKRIVNSDDSLFWDIYEKELDIISENVFEDYLALMDRSTTFSNDRVTIVKPRARERVTVSDLEKLQETSTPCIKIIGANVDLKGYEVTFCGKEEIIFDSCMFTGGGDSTLYFQQCNKIIIKNTTFNHFSNRVIQIKDVKTLDIQGCNFDDCIYLTTDKKLKNLLSGVIYSLDNRKVDNSDDSGILGNLFGNPDSDSGKVDNSDGGGLFGKPDSSSSKVNILDSTFHNCGCLYQGYLDNYNINNMIMSAHYNDRFGNITGILSNIACSVINCEFTYCNLLVNYGGKIMIDNEVNVNDFKEQMGLFDNQSKETNCVFNGSAKFSYCYR